MERVADCHGRSCHLPFLEKRLFEHPFLYSQSYLCGYRLVDGQAIWTVCSDQVAFYQILMTFLIFISNSDVSRD